MEKTQLRTTPLGSTRLEIDPIAEAANLELTDDDIQTIAGRS